MRAAAAQALFFLIFLFLVRRLFKHAFTIFHFFFFSLLRIFYLQKGELTQTLGPQIDDANNFLPVFVI
jgi:hypothetical protein